MSVRLTNGLHSRPLLALLGALVAVSACITSGCGGGVTTVENPDAGDSSVGQGSSDAMSSSGASSSGASSSSGSASSGSSSGDATVSGSSSSSSSGSSGTDGSSPVDATLSDATSASSSGSSGADGSTFDATVSDATSSSSGGPDGGSDSSSSSSSSSGGSTSSSSSSSSGGGDDGGSSSSSSSGGGADSGADSGADTGTGADAGADSEVDSGLDAPTDSGSAGDGNSCGPYTVPMCGTTPCDLHTNICCLTLSLAGRCLSKDDGGTCNLATEVAIACSDECECPTGQVCCAVRNGLTAVSECQTVPAGGHCQPYPQTSTTAAAQFCARSPECVTGDECLYQTCVLGANLAICGLQSQAPWDCVPYDSGAGD